MDTTCEDLGNNSIAVEERLNLDVFPALEPGDKRRHILDTAGPEQDSALSSAVIELLKELHIDVSDVSGRPGRSKARKSPRRGDATQTVGSKLVEATLKDGTCVTIPFILKETCEFIRGNIHVEGIFRKSGSSHRIQSIMRRFTDTEEAKEYFTSSDTVFEAASVLKQFLRESTPSLIPIDVQNLLLKCFSGIDPKTIIYGVLMAIMLVPMQNLNILSYLMEFLNDVVHHSMENLMTCKNLAIVIGPNIMPVDSRRLDKGVKRSLHDEKKLIDSFTRVVQILIQYGDFIGFVSPDLERTLTSSVGCRSSEDELDVGVSRRKKRRSGSLTRMLGFFKKTSKSNDTPVSCAATPMRDGYTPVIKGSNSKQPEQPRGFNHKKKNSIFHAVSKHGFTTPGSDVGTPNFQGHIVCPSPVCVHPSPMVGDWKTPNGLSFRNFVTPRLLRKRDKSPCPQSDNRVFSVPSRKPRLGFGKRSEKKISQTVKKPSPARVNPARLKRNSLQENSSSNVSIHHLAKSPRSIKVSRISSTKIPRPGNGTSTSNLRKSNSTIVPSKDIEDTTEFVSFSSAVSTGEDNNDNNNAFIASSISSFIDPDESNQSMTKSEDVQPLLRLTPLIQEIDALTLTACQEADAAVTKLERRKSTRSTSSFKNSSRKGANDSVNNAKLHKVEEKFDRALKETRILQLQSESASKNKVQRHFSVQERGVSPSHRRIRSIRRRRTHEFVRGGIQGSTSKGKNPVDTVNNTLQTSSVVTPPLQSCSGSPNRCTLRRGRPNTMKSGLGPRPSPARPPPQQRRSSINKPRAKTPPFEKDENCPQIEATTKQNRSSLNKPRAKTPPTLNNSSDFEIPTNTPLRRISSVHELVQKLELKKERVIEKQTSGSKLRRMTSSQLLPPPPLPVKNINKSPRKPTATIHPRRATVDYVRKKPSEFAAPMLPKTPSLSTKRNAIISQQPINIDSMSEEDWVPATMFNFKRKDFESIRRPPDRDSIQVLKTVNAGKVSQNVKMFDNLGTRHRSPRRSQIPRYTALRPVPIPSVPLTSSPAYSSASASMSMDSNF